MDMMIAVVLTIMTAATPLLLAALGELVVERSGVLNLGVEGMMVMGAVCGFGAALMTGSPWLGLLASIAAGMLMSLLFGFLTLSLVSNQVATGLALTLLGLGLSGQIGESFVGQPGVKLPNFDGFDPLIPFAILLAWGVSWFLFQTKAGLIVRAVGNSHASAHALGYHVIRVRYLCVLFGGACAGLAGGYLSLVYTPQWIENMTSGRGWIALALVVFASWRPWRAAGRCLSFRRHLDPCLHRPDFGVGNPLAVLVIAALSRHHHRPRGHLRQPDADESEYAGMPGSALRA